MFTLFIINQDITPMPDCANIMEFSVLKISYANTSHV